ncbi:MAG: matrixin family metalloprotease [Myxococcales bacterium]|nr:matrixin family metalloprotease [Myxococcales bacterium]
MIDTAGQLPRPGRAALPALTTAALVACGLWPATTGAYCRLTTDRPLAERSVSQCPEGGSPLSWQRACISYSVVERSKQVPSLSELRDTVDRSFQTWSQVECEDGPLDLDLRQTEGLSECGSPEHAPRDKNTNSIIFVEDWTERGLPAEAFGLTLIFHSPESGQIFDADMQINETMGELSICDGPCPEGQFDLQNVVTHEAGHFLGLGHTPVPTAAMHGEAELGEIRKRFLTSDDVAGICETFGAGEQHLACKAVDYAPIGGFTARCFDADSCAVLAPGAEGSAARSPLGLRPGLLLALAALTWRAAGGRRWRRWRRRRRR